MLNLTQKQLVELWSELEQCYYNDNSYGGDVAEIYAYRLQEYNPILAIALVKGTTGGFFDVAIRKAAISAAKNLYHLLILFSETRTVKIDVELPGQESKELGTWLLEAELHHRCHVKIRGKLCEKPSTD